ncbi:MAG: hypothetical protein GKR89_13300 [Candidatus Latescibacteria bacterium]|nr:hypothetical protein [Candidatus Latescibacterota bacterium]
MVGLIDTHCHLDQLPDPAAALQQAAAQGVEQLVAVAENPSSMRAVLKLKTAFPQQVFACIGLHPAWVIEAKSQDIERGLDFLASHLIEADAVGEIGLDHKWATTPQQQALQEAVFDRQLELAAHFTKPVNLHSRRCLRQVMEKAAAFKKASGLNAQLHWFTQSKKLVRICNAENLFVSVGPTVLNDPATQQVALEIADHLLLLETDAPVPIGGRPGHPAQIRQVAETLAALKNSTWEQIAALSNANFQRYLQPSPTPNSRP